MKKNLVIVESPSKAKTINKFLGSDYLVTATVGHIKNLPKNKISVDLENGYKPNFEVMEGKEKVIKELIKLARISDKIFIATDPDREGEAIASDIADEIKNINSNIKRVLFDEITKTGIDSAMKEPMDINEKLVDSQVARRVMDRILGYKVSPFLWKTFFYGLSAGRVQSVALRLICERETEIMNFKPNEYWTIDGIFLKKSGGTKSFKARLFKINNEVLKFNGEQPCISNFEQANKILEDLKNNDYIITDVQTKEVKRNSPLPFTTSVLQQTASTQLGFTPKKTMTLAQKLYEGIEIHKGEGNIGLITYMRTDSTRVSPEAVRSAQEFITKNYGSEYIGISIRKSKKTKNSQDAHEAIRPTDVNIKPDDLKKIDKNLFALYSLIWKRFIASQMSQAVYDQKTVIIKALSPSNIKEEYYFKATGSDMKFSGYLKVYEFINGDKSEEEVNEEESIIPSDINVNDYLKIANLIKERHFTNPPPRYTESSLIKQLDTLGIGRPSTFALIVSTVIDRKYVELKDRKLYASPLGMSVNKILIEHFPDVIDVSFTAKMEEELDTIAKGKSTYKKVLDDFYIPFSKDLNEAESSVRIIKSQLTEKTDIECPECGKDTGSKMVKKWGKNGQFLTCSTYPKCKSSMPLIEEHKENLQLAEGIKCDKCGADMVVKVGKYGKFYGCVNYPKCKGVKSITLGIVCPKCNEGEIIIRKGGKSKRKFYGCTRYPDCDFISNGEPVIQICTNCNNNYLIKKSTEKEGEYLQCPVCKTKHKLKMEKSN